MTDKVRARSPASLMRDPGHCLSLGLGSGCISRAPGTWGTLAGLLVYGVFFWVPLAVYLTVVVTAFVAGIYLCERTARALGVHDDGAIVWDEFVGVWIALAFQPSEWEWIAAAFVVFRFFDIIKPWPISWLDRRVSGGMGIMIDDVLAGIYALVVLLVFQAIIPH
jgi:phosphatidylglycerophosphatase A